MNGDSPPGSPLWSVDHPIVSGGVSPTGRSRFSPEPPPSSHWHELEPTPVVAYEFPQDFGELAVRASIESSRIHGVPPDDWLLSSSDSENEGDNDPTNYGYVSPRSDLGNPDSHSGSDPSIAISKSDSEGTATDLISLGDVSGSTTATYYSENEDSDVESDASTVILGDEHDFYLAKTHLGLDVLPRWWFYCKERFDAAHPPVAIEARDENEFLEADQDAIQRARRAEQQMLDVWSDDQPELPSPQRQSPFLDPHNPISPELSPLNPAPLRPDEDLSDMCLSDLSEAEESSTLTVSEDELETDEVAWQKACISRESRSPLLAMETLH